MTIYTRETVIHTYHWNDALFSFKTTRQSTLRFRNGHFLMLCLEINNKPLARAYSIVSANYETYLEFLSIKINDGLFTSVLKEIKIGDEILVSKKSVGTLITDNLKPGKRLYLFCTGTGLAPFMSIVRDPEIYDRFEKIILIHGVRFINELAYRDFICNILPQDKYLGFLIKEKLIYYPTVTREPFYHTGRLTQAIQTGTLFKKIKLPQLNPTDDRIMICGSSSMLADISNILNMIGFEPSLGSGHQGDYVFERAFVDK